MLELVTRAQVAQWRISERLRGEQGQTTSEYMVIAGVVVVILLAVFGLFRDQITTAMNTLMGNVNEGVTSGAR
jgi:Flp pilus assembly pilin Flp